MKNKKLKKLVKLIYDESEKLRYDDKCVPTKCAEDIRVVAEYDPEVSEKFKKILLNLVNYKNTIRIDINEERINISTDDIKNIKPRSNSNKKYSEDDYLNLYLTKSEFSINYGYRFHTVYKDSKLFDELYPIVLDKLKKINSDNFSEIWETIMRDSGIIRDNNLDEILNDL